MSFSGNNGKNKNRYAGFHRISIILYFFYFVVGIIILRFFYLQIIKGDFFYQKSVGNTEREYRLFAPRGLIYDRNGLVLSKNRTAFALSLVGGYIPRKKTLRDGLFQEIVQMIGVDPAFLEKKYIENRRNYRAVLIKESLSRSELIYLNEFKKKYPFLIVSEYSGRTYPYSESLAPVLGYIGVISQSEYNLLKTKDYTQESMIGKAGIEKQYDSILKGQDGRLVRVVNSLGQAVQTLNEKNIAPISGKDLVLSIDGELQDIIYHSFRGRKGAIIVTKVDTGEVICLVSAPSYNANTFINTNYKSEMFKKLLNDPEKPFLNRAIQGQYAPGSVFKIVVALSALEDNKLNPKKVEDTHLGYFKLGKHLFRNYGYKPSADLATALEKSNNVYFYRLGHSLGYSSILEYSALMGLREKTHIDLPNEISNFTPTPEWKEKRFKEVWVEGDTVNISIGQGFLIFTPLGIHNIISTIAADKVVRPRVVWEIKNPYTGALEQKFTSILNSSFTPKQENLEAIREGLARVPNTGTGIYHKYLSKVKIAGKTGTTQNSTGKDHALFTSYGPLDAPLDKQYAVTVLVESGGYGSGVVPISSVIYNYLTGAQTREQVITTLNRILPAIKNIKEED